MEYIFDWVLAATGERIQTSAPGSDPQYVTSKERETGEERINIVAYTCVV